MRISIVTPALNEEEDLPVLLESLKQQSFRDFEVIVADAGSKDRTVEIAESFGARVVPGGMPGPGRNRGAEAANGEFLFFFDADVELPPDFLEKAVSELDERMLDLATCEFYPKSDLRLDQAMFRMANLSVKMSLDINPRAPGFCIFITRRLFQRIGGFDESLKLAEDHDLVRRAAEFRPLRLLRNSYIQVSVRRLEKEGRFSLIQKYIQVEAHLLFKGNVREDIVDYEFGAFGGDKEASGRILDEVENRIIQLEQAYNRWTGETGASDPSSGATTGKNDFLETWRNTMEQAWERLVQLSRGK